jgi:hypothetical protein
VAIPLAVLRRVVTPVRVEGGYRESSMMAREDADQVLEIGSLVLAGDSEPTREERAAFEAISAALRDLTGDVQLPDLEVLWRRLPPGRRDEAVRARARVVGAAMKAEGVRRLAYKVAFALMLSDLAISETESVLDEWVRNALDLSPDDAQELTGEVYETLQGGGGADLEP